MPAHTGVESSPLSRRAFVGAAAGAAASLLVGRARAEDTFVVGLVLPPASDAGALEQGARLGLEEANALATLFGKRLRMESETAADAGAAGRAATAMVRAGALALVGGAGNGYADALRDAAATGNALFLNTAARDDRLRQERCDKHTFHVIPGVTMYVDALAQWAASRQLMRWAIFGDGTPRAQEVEAAVRRALTRHAGASLAADRSSADLLILAGDSPWVRLGLVRARAEGRSGQLCGITGDIPESMTDAEATGVWIVAWHRELERFSATDLNSRFERRAGRPLTETGWAAWATLKLIGEGVVRGGATDPERLRAFLESSPPFDAQKGVALTFRPWDHQLRQPLYAIGPRTGGDHPGFTVLADLPGSNLDAIGITAAESRCRLGS